MAANARVSGALTPRVYLDEIDVLQMAYSAIEMYPNEHQRKENYGIFLGETDVVRNRLIYRVHFVQDLKLGKRHKEGVFYSDKALLSLKKRYCFDIIGDFHSHPGNAEKNNDEYPSLPDLESTFGDFGNGALIAVLTIKLLNKNAGDFLLIRRRTKIKCLFGEFAISVNFFTFKDGVKKITRKKTYQTLIRRVWPRVFLRKKIHKSKKSTGLQII